MKKIFILLLFLFAFAGGAQAAPVSVSQTTIQGWTYGGASARLRIFANSQFVTSDGKIINAGSQAKSSWYKEIVCAISGTTLTVPAFQIDTTTDSDVKTATYSAVFYDAKGVKRDNFFPDIPNFRVPNLFGAKITWIQIRTYNLTAPRPPTPNYPNVDQVITLINQNTLLSTPVTSVAGKTGAIFLNKADVGLDQVVNISEEQRRTQLETLANKTISGGLNNFSNIPQSAITDLPAALAAISTGGAGNRNSEVNGATSGYATLSAAVVSIGSTQATLNIYAPVNCATAIVVPKNVTLEFTKTGAIVSNGAGCRLTINGGIQAAKNQIFTGFTRDSLFLAANVDEYYPEWFGAKGDGSNDDFPAIQLMFDAVNYGVLPSDGQNFPSGGRFRFLQKGYRHTQEIRVNKPVEINGAGGSYRNNFLVALNHPVNAAGIVFEDAAQPRQYNVSTVAGSPNVVSLDSRFSQIDIGKPVSVGGAGAVAGGFPTDMNGTIIAVTDQTHITLSVNAGITMADTGLFLIATTGTTGAKGSILRGVAIGAGGGSEGNNLTLSTFVSTAAGGALPLGKIAVTGTSGNGRQLYNADSRQLNAASHRGFPEGTVIGIGATRWILNYFSANGYDEIPYITSRFAGQTFAGQSIVTSATQDIEPWMLGSRVKINGRYYLLGAISGVTNGIGASREAVLYYAPQGDNQPLPEGVVGSVVTTLPNWSGTVEIISPATRTGLAAHAYVRHGVEAQVSMTVENCFIHGSYGSNIVMDSFIVTNGAENNINYARIAKNFLYDAQGHGVFLRGKNSNAINVEANDSSQNEGYAYYDASGLGNTYFANHANVSKLGAFFSDTIRNVNQSTYISNYAEAGSPCNTIAPTAIWLGGVPGNGFCPQENQGAVFLGTIGGSKLATLTGGIRAVNETPLHTDGNGNVYTDLLPTVSAQIGAEDTRPTLFGFGAADDGVNRPGEPGGGTKPNYSWVYNKLGLMPGWYTFGYQLFGSVTQPAQVLMAVSGTNTILGTNASPDYNGSYRLWFPNKVGFGQIYTSGNGKAGYEPRFMLNTDAIGLTLDGNFKPSSVQLGAFSLVNNSLGLNLDGNFKALSLQVNGFRFTSDALGVNLDGNLKAKSLQLDSTGAQPPCTNSSPTFWKINGTGAGVQQVETAAVTGTITSANDTTVATTVTAAGLTGSPVTITTVVQNGDTAATVAARILYDLEANSLINNFFTITRSGAAITLTSKNYLGNDASLNVATANGTSVGLTNTPASANTTAGVFGSADALQICRKLENGSYTWSNVPLF